jgi:hypothetical protein
MSKKDTDITPAMIEASEAAGQRALVESTLLPVDFRQYTELTLERIGIVVDRSAVVDGLFYRTTLPGGWRKVPAKYSMWSHLVDGKGRTRASIFYKAAFYDRRAFWSLNRRYSTEHYYERERKDQYGLAVRHAFVVDQSIEPKEGDPFYDEWNGADHAYQPTIEEKRAACLNAIVHVPEPPENDDDYLPDSHIKNPDTSEIRCRRWLDEHKPNWQDPTAYWDE